MMFVTVGILGPNKLIVLLSCSVVSVCNSFGNAAATAQATDNELYGYLTTSERVPG